MSFRRMPFQFTTADPIERQRELERRFGLPASTNRKMFVDVPNPLLMGAVPRELNTSSNSPRLQHRVPIFGDGNDQSLHSSVDSTGSYPENKKPNVRVIPIEIEGAESKPTRHRTFSGPVRRADDSYDRNFSDSNDIPLKRSMEDLSRPSNITNTTGSRVHNIPIQFEGSNNTVKNMKLENVNKTPSKVNGCAVTKSFKSPGKENKAGEEINKVKPEDHQKVVNKVKPEDHQKIGIETSLKKIENVLEELKIYETEIQDFNGTIKDKKYRYLDEMLTRCMIKLDDVDTMGNEHIRSTRKNAVKKIQAQIDLLERRANAVNESETTLVNSSQAQVSENIDIISEQISDDKSEQQNEVEMVGGKESKLLEKENVGDIDSKEKLEGELGVKMTESEADVKQTNEGIESQPDVEMADKPEEQAREIIKSQLDTENIEKSEILPEMKETGESDNVHEVEMSEVAEPSIAQDFSGNYEIEEVEMTEKGTNLDLSNIDNPTEARNKQIMKPQDVEMKDVQNILDNAKTQVQEDIASSETKENESGNGAEAIPTCNKDSQDMQCKIDIKSANRPH